MDEPVVKRRAARVIVTDTAGRVLLFRGCDPARPHARCWWFAAGGGVDAGETAREAARRELREETGLHDVGDLGPVVLNARVHYQFEGARFDQHEDYFLVQVPPFTVHTSGWTEAEHRGILEHRWWTRDELRTTTAAIHPAELSPLLDRLLPE